MGIAALLYRLELTLPFCCSTPTPIVCLMHERHENRLLVAAGETCVRTHAAAMCSYTLHILVLPIPLGGTHCSAHPRPHTKHPLTDSTSGPDTLKFRAGAGQPCPAGQPHRAQAERSKADISKTSLRPARRGNWMFVLSSIEDELRIQPQDLHKSPQEAGA